MCDPITIAGAVLTVAGTAANMIANQQVAAARADVLAAERIRQDSYNREAEGLVDTSRDRFSDFDTKRGGRAEQLADYFAPANTNTQSQGLLPESSSSITVANEKGARAKAGADVARQAHNLGDLRAFGDLFGDLTREQAADAARVGMVGSFKRGSQAILPLELEEANNAGAGLSLLGGLLSGAGKVAIGAGLGGAKINLGSSAFTPAFGGATNGAGIGLV